jgi:hypothetical protein
MFSPHRLFAVHSRYYTQLLGGLFLITLANLYTIRSNPQARAASTSPLGRDKVNTYNTLSLFVGNM